MMARTYSTPGIEDEIVGLGLRPIGMRGIMGLRARSSAG